MTYNFLKLITFFVLTLMGICAIIFSVSDRNDNDINFKILKSFKKVLTFLSAHVILLKLVGQPTFNKN